MTMDYEAKYLSEPGAVGLFTRLTRVGLLVDAFQHRCLDGFGLLFIDYSVLRVLQLAGAPYRMSPTELAEVVLRSSGGMTQILDRLERAGLVARTPDPADRRKVLVALTDELEDAQHRVVDEPQPERIEAAVLERVDQETDACEAGEQSDCARLGEVARFVVDAHRATGPAIVARCMMRRSR